MSLGEIESVLRDLTGLSDTAVVLQKRDAGDLLVAFVVDTEERPKKPKECTATLWERLPAYMVPALIVLLRPCPQKGAQPDDRGRRSSRR